MGLPRIRDLVFAAVDTETTGLRRGRIVEVAAVRFTCDDILDEHSTLVDPGGRVPRAAVAVHGITNAMLAGKPSPSEALPTLAEFIAGCVAWAHHATFDRAALTRASRQAALDSSGFELFDSMPLCRRLLPHLPSYRLERVASSLGIAVATRHRALADARTLAAVVQHCLRLLPADTTMDHATLFASRVQRRQSGHCRRPDTHGGRRRPSGLRR